MSGVQGLRDFIRERLAAAAEDIVAALEQTLARCEEERERPHGLLGTGPEPPTHTAEPLHQYKEEEASREQPEPPQVKGEHLLDQDAEQQGLKQEVGALLVTLGPGAPDLPVPRSAAEQQELEGRGVHLRPLCYLSEGRGQADVTPQACERCGNVFQEASVRKRHQKVHTGDRSLSCETCGQGFRDGLGPWRPPGTRTGETPDARGTSGRTLAHRPAMLRHARARGGGGEPLACRVCGKRFTDKPSLRGHLKIHGEERRRACRTRRRSLVKTRSTEKNFSCSTCGKAFKFHFKLSYHEKTHADEKWCFCDACGGTFSDPAALKTHTRTHTGLRCWKRGEGLGVKRLKKTPQLLTRCSLLLCLLW